MPKATLRSVRGGRPYAEAFPVLDILGVEREIAANRRVCQWTNERGVIVGHVEVSELSGDRMMITTHLLGAANVGYKHSADVFGIRRKKHNENHAQPTIACPDCGRSVRLVYNVAGHWTFRLCHGLTTIKRRLNDVIWSLRRVQELKVLVARGRPRYGRKAAFEALQQEMGVLVREFSDAPELHPELCFAQYAEWLGSGDPRIKRQVEDGDEGYGWTRFDEGGFRRLTWAAEQEMRRHDDAELATRDRAGASAVQPLWRTGPNVAQKPHGLSPAVVPPPEPMRLHFSFEQRSDEDE